MVRRRGFGHFGAGGHERVVEKLTVIARVSDEVDDAHNFFFFEKLLFSFFLSFCFLFLVTLFVFMFGWQERF